jgi:hypothetical protein
LCPANRVLEQLDVVAKLARDDPVGQLAKIQQLAGPVAYPHKATVADPEVFNLPSVALDLCIGKNMVEAIRFCGLATKVVGPLLTQIDGGCLAPYRVGRPASPGLPVAVGLMSMAVLSTLLWRMAGTRMLIRSPVVSRMVGSASTSWRSWRTDTGR